MGGKFAGEVVSGWFAKAGNHLEDSNGRGRSGCTYLS